MATYKYTPSNQKLPPLQKFGMTSQLPQANINNTYAKNILDSFRQNLKAPTAFTQNNDLNNSLFPYQELGRQFIENNVVPEFQQNIYNPFRRQLGNRSAGSNIGLLGNRNNFVQQQTRQVTQPFEDQTSQIEQTFADIAQQDLNDRIKAWYDSQLNF